MSITRRPYRGEADLPALVALRLAADAAGAWTRWFSAAELRIFLSTPSRFQRDDTCLWEDARGELLAFALLWDMPTPNARGVVCFVHPTHQASDLEAETLRWALARARALRTQRGELLTLSIRPRDDASALIRRLDEHGFVRQSDATVCFARTLTEPVPRDPLPAGVVVRSLGGVQEVEAFVALYRDAMVETGITVERRLQTMRDPEYDPDLDLVAVAPGGTLAAFCTCHIDVGENTRSGRHEGWTDPIGTRPAYRRRGLMRALLREGCHRLQARGMERALLCTGDENRAAQRACLSAGYQLLFTAPAYTREV